MSIADALSAAAGSVTAKPKAAAAHYSAVRGPVFDSDSNRTYQLIERDSDHVPHCVSCAGNHDDGLSALNDRARLQHERPAADDKSAAADKDRKRVTAAIKDLRAVSLERTDRVTRMLMAYGAQESE